MSEPLSDPLSGLPGRALRIGEWLLVPESHRLSRADTTHVLRAKLVQILVCLAERPGRVLSRDQLLDRVWPGVVVTDDSVTRGISELRKLFGDSADAPEYIETIRKGGYRLIAPVEVVAEELLAPARGTDRPPPRPAPPRPPARSGLQRSLVAAGALAASVLLFLASLEPSIPAEPAPTFEPRPFTTLVGREIDPAVSPDGARVAFAWSGEGGEDGASFDLYVKSLGDDGMIRLTSDAATDRSPAWSPDGRHVAFLRAGGEAPGVYVVPSRGGTPRCIASTSSWLLGLDWSRDGRRLAFAGTSGDYGPLQVRQITLEPDGAAPSEQTEPVALSEPPPLHSDHSPAFAPDGTTVAFVRTSWTRGRDTIVIRQANGAAHAFAAYGRVVRGLEWGADGEHLLVASTSGNSTRLYRTSIDDGSATVISVLEEQVTAPSLSADGRVLIYQDARPRHRLFSARLTGGEEPPDIVPILATTHSDREVDHSPDGKRLVIVSDRNGSSELWVTHLDGSQPRRITESGTDVVRSPRWSPSGEHVAYLQTGAVGSPGTGLWIASHEGRDRRRVHTLDAGVLLSDWSRDGQALYVSSDVSGEWRALRVELDAALRNGSARSVAPPGTAVVFESPDARTLYFSKAREKGIWRMPRAGGTVDLVVPSFDPVFTPSWGFLGERLFFAEWDDDRSRLVALDPRSNEVLAGKGERETIVRAPWRHAAGFSLSPSGEDLVISLTYCDGSDLNLIENFARPRP